MSIFIESSCSNVGEIYSTVMKDTAHAHKASHSKNFHMHLVHYS